jgi:hypothetical protein
VSFYKKNEINTNLGALLTAGCPLTHAKGGTYQYIRGRGREIHLIYQQIHQRKGSGNVSLGCIAFDLILFPLFQKAIVTIEKNVVTF